MKLLLAASISRITEAENALGILPNHKRYTIPRMVESTLKDKKPKTLEGYIWCPADSSEDEKDTLIRLAHVVSEYKNFNNIMPNNIHSELSAKLRRTA